MRIFLIISLLVVSLSVMAEQTTRKRLKVKPVKTEAASFPLDSVVPDSAMVIVAGYDKPLTSRRESFFVTNRYDRTLASITIELNYYDKSQRQLHSATQTIACDIPPGETRQLTFTSWDKQLNFYYYRSPQPRRQATPFWVKHRLLLVKFAAETKKQ